MDQAWVALLIVVAAWIIIVWVMRTMIRSAELHFRKPWERWKPPRW